MPGERINSVNVPLPRVDPAVNPTLQTVQPITTQNQRMRVPEMYSTQTNPAVTPVGVTVPDLNGNIIPMPSNAEFVAAARNQYEKTSNPMSAFAQGFSNTQALKLAKEREVDAANTKLEQAEAEKAKQLDFLRRMDPEMAAAVEAGVLDAQTAYTTSKSAKAGKYSIQKMENGDLIRINEGTGDYEVLGNFGKAAQPESAAGKLEADYRNGMITKEAYELGLANLAPKGTRVEVDADGNVSIVDGPGVTNGMPTLKEGEGKNTGFLLRAKDANAVIDKFESEGTNPWNKVAKEIPLGAGNYTISQDAQKLDQAKRDFINAVLRQESGAVIAQEEFDNADQQYFPQLGDGADVIEQKRKNRENAIEGFRIRSGAGAGVVDQIGESRTGEDARTDAKVTNEDRRPITEEEFNALPSGSTFIAPDGTTRRKP